MLKSVQGVLFDMDGVLYHGTQRLAGVLEFFQWLQQRRIPYLFVTNNSTRTPEQVCEVLAGMQIPAAPEQVLSSALATAYYLKEIAPAQAAVYVVGEYGLYYALEAQGFVIRAEHPAYVVVGLDRQFNETKAEVAAAAIRQGATLIATNADMALMTENGAIPGAGTMVAAIEARSGQKAVVIGKPERRMFEMAAQKIGSPAKALMMIGDNLHTDIAGSKQAGMCAVLVLTGVSTRHDAVVGAIKPSLIVDDLGQLLRAWQHQLR